MNFNFKTRLTVGVIVLSGLFYLQIPQEKLKNSLTNGDLKGIISTVEDAFDKAEKKILDSKPDVPDDTPLVPDPDPEKCVCKGTGKIVHGDGHVTPCPYHSKEARCKCDSPGYYCNCREAYGSCQCEKIVNKDSSSSRAATQIARKRKLYSFLRIFFN